jgi:integrase
MLTVCNHFGVKKPTLAVLPYRHDPKYKFVLDLRAFGRGRKFFKTRAEAEAERLRQKTALERHGREAIGLPQHELSDFIRARKTLTDYGKTINDATAFYVDHLERVQRCKITVAQLAEEVIEAKRRDGMSTAYLSDLRKRFTHFSRDFGNRPIAGITVEELDDWLRDLPLSPKSRANYRANIGVLLSYAVRRRMLDFNPVLHTTKPKLPDNPPEIFTVNELRALLESASWQAPDVLPMLTIGAFAGLRDAEIKRLDWSEVGLARGHIEVKAAKAKSARRRIVLMQPNLAAWLRPYSGMTGPLVPFGARRKLDRVRDAAGFARWPKNGLRHSFASYRLAATNDAAKVAAELGHSTSQMLYSTYRELVLPEEAEDYWSIKPIADANNVIPWKKGELAAIEK